MKDRTVLRDRTARQTPELPVLRGVLDGDPRPRALLMVRPDQGEATIVHASPALRAALPLALPQPWEAVFAPCRWTSQDHQEHSLARIGAGSVAGEHWHATLFRYRPAGAGVGIAELEADLIYFAEISPGPVIDAAGTAPAAPCHCPPLPVEGTLLTDTIARMDAGLVVVDGSLQVVYWNPAFCRLLDLTANLLHPGMSLSDLCLRLAERGLFGPGQPAPLGEETLLRIVEGRRPVWEQRLGRHRVLEFRRSRLEGGCLALLCLDVTGRRNLDQALTKATIDARNAHGRLVDAIAALSEGFLLFAADDRLVVANRTAARLIDPDHAVIEPDMTLSELAEQAIAAGLFPSLSHNHELLAALRQPRFEREDTARNGRTIRCVVRATSDFGRVMLLSDVTELRRRERAWHQQSELLRTLFDNMDDGLLAFDAERRVLLWNDRFRMIFDLEAGILQRGMPAAEVLTLLARRGEYVYEPTLNDIEGHVSSLFEPNGRVHVRRRPNGRVIQSRRSHLPLGGLVILYVDITEQRAAEEALARASEEAQAANRAKSQFLAHMSHELRTPLNAIIGFSEVIERELFGPCPVRRYIDYATAIQHSGRHLLDLINDILDLSRIEAGRLDLSFEMTDIGELIAAAEMMVAAKADRKNISLNVATPQVLPELSVDRRAIRQVLINLLDNAVKFTRPGGHVTLAVICNANKSLTFTISDTGVGIPPDKLDKVFIPFERGDERIARQEEGTGLGLPLARRLVEMHGGQLTLTSTQGVGTEVTLTLPIDDENRIPCSL